MGKSLCVFVAYDKQNIIDAYIGFMLSELRKNVDYIIVVCNEQKIIRGKEYITAYADEIFYRKNIGYDAGAFKDVLCNLAGWKMVWNYDELYLINDSFFGPFSPMVNIFNEMKGKNCDFWGLTLCKEANTETYGRVPTHIQSFFICVRKKMLHDIRFKEYWESMPYFKNFDDVVKNHEIRFTKHFSQLGYKYATLADTEPNDSDEPENNYSQYMYLSYELLVKRNFPFLKKQQLAYNTLNKQTQENLRQSIEYIDKYTDYDINLIWDNITRTLSRKALQHSLHLRYIISDECSKTKCSGQAVILVMAEHFNACEYVFDYIENILKEVDICIVTDVQDIANYYKDRDVRVCCQIDMEAVKSHYKYVCLLKDEDMSSDIRPSMINKSLFFGIWNNLIKNTDFISNVIAKFEEEKRLGFLYIPRPMFTYYFGQKTYSMEGWIRSSLLDCYSQSGNIDDVEEKVWRLGYYSGTVESSENASIYETNLVYYLETLIDQTKRLYGGFSEFSEMKKLIFKGALSDFCDRYSPIYIYGAGFMAKQYMDILCMAKGYIVSDGQENAGEVDGRKIWYLSEVEYEENMGIVICVDLKYQNQIISLLQKKGFHNYICI